MKLTSLLPSVLTLALWFGYSGSACADVKLPGIFSDHMVMQRGVSVPVWGWAAAGEAVSVSFAGQQQNVTADAYGQWKVKLQPLEASAVPGELVVRGNNTVTFQDVVVGEVWFCSGQSNMEWSVEGHPTNPPPRIPCDEATQKLVGAPDHPLVRISAHTRDHLKTPNGGWVHLSSENRTILPALPVCTAILLQQALNVPVGVIVRCESSGRACLFMNRDAVAADAAIQAEIEAYRGEYPQLLSKYQADLAAWQAAADQAKAAGQPEPKRKPQPPAEPGLEAFADGKQHDLVGARYDLKIAPVIGYAVRGIFWDQGEAGTGIGGAKMTTVLPNLFRSWRELWGQGTLPFIYIRKNQHPPELEGVMARLAPTAMVDNRGLKQDLHPLDKAAYAERVVAQMMKTVYPAEKQ